jgi:prepilin-type N-terminal cleavage/methylation domain-containing protein
MLMRLKRIRDAYWCSRRGFTLVELLVTIVIISILASLTLAGLAGARNRSKIGKTESTIRKVADVVQPLFDSYFDRRVGLGTSGGNAIHIAALRLTALRRLQSLEIPERLTDFLPATAAYLPPSNPLPALVTGTSPMAEMQIAWQMTPLGGSALSVSGTATDTPRTAIRFANYRYARPDWNRTSRQYETAECLYMLLAASPHVDPAEMEQFRPDEIGDSDDQPDGAFEILDGWGKPVFFLRWAPGFVSLLQPETPTSLDPLDSLRLQSASNGFPRNAYQLTPLVYSPGPDGIADIRNSADSATWSYAQSTYNTALPASAQFNPFDDAAVGFGAFTDTDGDGRNGSRDNITNHDMRR